MIISSRGIIIDNQKILLIHRIKKSKEFYVLPGGKVEDNEMPIDTVIREVKEETNLNIEVDKLLWEHDEHVIDDKRNEIRKGHYFLVKSFKGKLQLGGPELKQQSKDNKYILEWVSINKLRDILMYPEEIKEMIMKEFRCI